MKGRVCLGAFKMVLAVLELEDLGVRLLHIHDHDHLTTGVWTVAEI